MRIGRWPLRRWLAMATGTALTALIVGIPTGIVQTSLYHRMTPVLWWNYPVWGATAVMSGLLLATYVRTQVPAGATPRMGLGGGVLSLLAVGCPVCNKLVVLAVGVTGALNLWAPLQPLLGVLSIGLLGWALLRRLRGERACPVDVRPARGVQVE